MDMRGMLEVDMVVGRGCCLMGLVMMGRMGLCRGEERDVGMRDVCRAWNRKERRKETFVCVQGKEWSGGGIAVSPIVSALV